jgi:hypothetical protein
MVLISIGDHEDGIGDDCIGNGEEVIILVMIILVMTVLVVVKFLL